MSKKAIAIMAPAVILIAIIKLKDRCTGDPNINFTGTGLLFWSKKIAMMKAIREKGNKNFFANSNITSLPSP